MSILVDQLLHQLDEGKFLLCSRLDLLARHFLDLKLLDVLHQRLDFLHVERHVVLAWLHQPDCALCLAARDQIQLAKSIQEFLDEVFGHCVVAQDLLVDEVDLLLENAVFFCLLIENPPRLTVDQVLLVNSFAVHFYEF